MPKKQVKPKVAGWIYWTPRIFSIFIVCFMVLFSFDVFGQGYGFLGTVLAFMIHNIPALIMAAIVVIAWRREFVGAVAFIAAGALYILNLIYAAARGGFEWYYFSWAITMAGPVFFVGALYYLNWKRKS